MKHRAAPLVLLAFVLGLSSAGCAAKRGLRQPDEGARGTKWKRAAVTALKDRGTWIPAAGAAVVSVGDWDEKISDWAMRETPVFGSQENALAYSGYLRTSTSLAMVGTSAAFLGGEGDWTQDSGRLLVGMGAVQAGNLLTKQLKRTTGRPRPNGGRLSFPSGHATQAFARASYASRNIDDIPNLSRSQRLAFKSTFRTLAAGTAWARVEGGMHYPSDVLFGAALGNFVAVLFHDAVLPESAGRRWSVELEPGRTAISFRFSPGSRAAARRLEWRSRERSGGP